MKECIRYFSHLYNKKKILNLIRSLQPQCTNKPLIRLGPQNDGGYLLPDDIDDINFCFSPGTGKTIGFEKDCLDRGMQVFMADASVNPPDIDYSDFHFIKKFIGPESDGTNLSITDWMHMQNIPAKRDLLLQMDIEGDEYEVIQAMPSELINRFRIIIVEFHNLYKLWNTGFLNMASNTFNKLLANHTCVHIHPNNYKPFHAISNISLPRAAEFTFFRNDRITWKKAVTNFPHPLDACNTDNPPMVLPEAWYK